MKKTIWQFAELEMETKDGYNAVEKWLNTHTQIPRNVKNFDNEEEAMEYYRNYECSCRNMSGYYLHQGKSLDIVTLEREDEDDEWEEVEWESAWLDFADRGN